jgi:hypothetical protein
MHCLRLYFECIELMREGRITLPRPEKEILIEVRSGDWTMEKFLREAERLQAEAEQSAIMSPLPDDVPKETISQLVAEAHLSFWKNAEVSEA